LTKNTLGITENVIWTDMDQLDIYKPVEIHIKVNENAYRLAVLY